MSRLLLISIPVLAICLSAKAQAPIWPTEDATWHVERVAPASFIIGEDSIGTVLFGFTTTQIYYSLEGIVSLAGTDYTSLVQQYEGVFVSIDGGTVMEFELNPVPELRGGFRSEGEQVYFYDITTQQDYLLYDFDLAEGDGLPVSYTNGSTGFTVDAVDTVSIGAIPRRAFSVSGPAVFFNQIVEGVGSLSGPVQSVNQGFDSSHRLVCHEVSGNPVFPFDGICADSASVLSTAQRAYQDAEISVYPNPAVDRISAQINRDDSRITAFNLYDLAGNTVRQKYFETALPGFHLYRKGLPAGVYLLRLEMDSGEKIVRKIVLL